MSDKPSREAAEKSFKQHEAQSRRTKAERVERTLRQADLLDRRAVSLSKKAEETKNPHTRADLIKAAASAADEAEMLRKSVLGAQGGGGGGAEFKKQLDQGGQGDQTEPSDGGGGEDASQSEAETGRDGGGRDVTRRTERSSGLESSSAETGRRRRDVSGAKFNAGGRDPGDRGDAGRLGEAPSTASPGEEGGRRGGRGREGTEREATSGPRGKRDRRGETRSAAGESAEGSESVERRRARSRGESTETAARHGQRRDVTAQELTARPSNRRDAADQKRSAAEMSTDDSRDATRRSDREVDRADRTRSAAQAGSEGREPAERGRKRAERETTGAADKDARRRDVTGHEKKGRPGKTLEGAERHSGTTRSVEKSREGIHQPRRARERGERTVSAAAGSAGRREADERTRARRSQEASRAAESETAGPGMPHPADRPDVTAKHGAERSHREPWSRDPEFKKGIAEIRAERQAKWKDRPESGVGAEEEFLTPQGAREQSRLSAKLKRSYEIGLEGTRSSVFIRSGITVDEWNNPFKHADIGDTGRGFDDIGTKRNGSKVILEWKGERGSESPGQLGNRWVGRKIAELEAVNDPKAQELLRDLKEGRLTSRTYTTKVVDGKLETTHTRTRYYKGKRIDRVLEAYAERLDHLKASPDALQQLLRGLPPKWRRRSVAATSAVADAPKAAKTATRSGSRRERSPRQSGRTRDKGDAVAGGQELRPKEAPSPDSAARIDGPQTSRAKEAKAAAAGVAEFAFGIAQSELAERALAKDVRERREKTGYAAKGEDYNAKEFRAETAYRSLQGLNAEASLLERLDIHAYRQYLRARAGAAKPGDELAVRLPIATKREGKTEDQRRYRIYYDVRVIYRKEAFGGGEGRGHADQPFARGDRLSQAGPPAASGGVEHAAQSRQSIRSEPSARRPIRTGPELRRPLRTGGDGATERGAPISAGGGEGPAGRPEWTIVRVEDWPNDARVPAPPSLDRITDPDVEDSEILKSLGVDKGLVDGLANGPPDQA